MASAAREVGFCHSHGLHEAFVVRGLGGDSDSLTWHRGRSAADIRSILYGSFSYPCR